MGGEQLNIWLDEKYMRKIDLARARLLEAGTNISRSELAKRLLIPQLEGRIEEILRKVRKEKG